MLTITKRSQAEEEFRRDKIENSMRNAGVTQDTAHKIAYEMVYHDGMTTAQIRNRVIGGIKNREPQAAMRYESHPKKSHRM